MEEEHNHHHKIRVFPLEDPQVWHKNRDAIKKTILAAINPELPGFLNVKHSFSIDPVSGWIRYSLDNDLWNDKPKRSLPENVEEARSAAENFISQLQSKCQEKEFLKLKIPPIFPVEHFAKIEHIVSTPVFHFKQPWVDHWLCRFKVNLKPFQDKNDFVSVYGSNIDIRIGQNRKVVGLISNWRPAWLEKNLMTEFISYQANTEQSDTPAHDEDEPTHEHEPAPPILYELDGENCPQNFLSPFHFVMEEHHGKIFPASNYSMVIRMSFIEKDGGGSFVLPIINGGGPEYLINWAFWRPDEIFDEGLVYIGEKNIIELPPGVYNLMLHVKDNKTSVIRLFENMAFVKDKQNIPNSSATDTPMTI